MPNSIDTAYDSPVTMDASILGLAYKVNEYLHHNASSFTDSYMDLMINAHLYMKNYDGFSGLDDYKEYILNTTFSYAGRVHYDTLKKIVDSYDQVSA